jgi:hypothetical protein
LSIEIPGPRIAEARKHLSFKGNVVARDLYDSLGFEVTPENGYGGGVANATPVPPSLSVPGTGTIRVVVEG